MLMEGFIVLSDGRYEDGIKDDLHGKRLEKGGARALARQDDVWSQDTLLFKQIKVRYIFL